MGERPEFQLHLVEGDEPVARVRAVPVRWDGTVADLPAGIDGAIARGFEEPGANTLSPSSSRCAARTSGAGSAGSRSRRWPHWRGGTASATLIAPVRPSWKERYPTVPIARYASWRRGDGLLFDPWLRVHERLGAEMLRPEPHSLGIAGAVAEWETWTAWPSPRAGSTSSRAAWRCRDRSRGGPGRSTGSRTFWMRHRLSA